MAKKNSDGDQLDFTESEKRPMVICNTSPQTAGICCASLVAIIGFFVYIMLIYEPPSPPQPDRQEKKFCQVRAFISKIMAKDTHQDIHMCKVGDMYINKKYQDDPEMREFYKGFIGLKIPVYFAPYQNVMSEDEMAAARSTSFNAIQKITNDNKMVVIFIYADWCRHCKTTLPEFVELSKKNKETKFMMINSENMCNNTFTTYDVTYFPTLIVDFGDCYSKATNMSEVQQTINDKSSVDTIPKPKPQPAQTKTTKDKYATPASAAPASAAPASAALSTGPSTGPSVGRTAKHGRIMPRALNIEPVESDDTLNLGTSDETLEAALPVTNTVDFMDNLFVTQNNEQDNALPAPIDQWC